MLKMTRRLFVSSNVDRASGQIRIQTYGTLFLLVILVAGCSPDVDPKPAYSGQLYPGAGLSFEFDEKELVLAAEYGDIYSDSGLVWFNAPLDNRSDEYSIAAADSGEVLAEGEIEVSMRAVAELELIATDDENAVSGRYGDALFSANGNDGVTGSAEFRLPGSDAVLAITLDGDDAYMDWRGVRLDGYGSLTDDESSALRELSVHPLARAVSMVALDLGCREDAQQIDSAAFAALVFPWQVILKYEVADRGRVIKHFLSEANCRFTGFAEEGSNEPLNRAIYWDSNHPIPTTPFVFPFDGDGQRESRP